MEIDMSEEITAWERVKIARGNTRPTSLDYIGKIFDKFLELHGDRVYGDDGAVVGGIAEIENIPVTIIGHQKGRTIKQNMKRNFGMPNPEGYRKALRLMKQAEKFKRPIICFVDTPGAFCGMEAEERGQAEAIAKNLMELSSLKTPILSIVIGEGGSGGALAMAVADEVWMLENATYSILSPEGFASILWKDSKRAGEAAEIMKITAKDLKDMKIIEKVIPETISEKIEENQEGETLEAQTVLLPTELTIENMDSLAKEMRIQILEFLHQYKNKTIEELIKMRYQRFRKL